MKGKHFRKLIAIFTAALLLGSCFYFNFSKDASAAESTSLTNLVIFVDFKDTTHSHSYSFTPGACFMSDPKINDFFSGTGNIFSLSSYVDKISYGKIKVINEFPQLSSATGLVTAVRLPKNIDEYFPSDGTNKVQDHTAIAYDTLKAIENNIPASINLDRDNNGIIDNIMIVFAADDSVSSAIGVAAYMSGITINGKQTGSYTLIPESTAYLSLSESGVICHEYLHTLGFPDLYSNRNVAVGGPVGRWDIMSSQLSYLQLPLAYTRQQIFKNFSIPTISSGQTGYTLYSTLSTVSDGASAGMRDRQAVILKTSYSDSEFFVIEYRRKTSSAEAVYGGQAYEHYIHGSGLIIYRVNTNTSGRNTDSGPFYIYVFRPGDTYTGGIEAAAGDLDSSFLSLESGRTGYGSADFNKGLSDGAITYSDGTNSGIVVKNVGSAGDSISFDIEFNKASGIWESNSSVYFSTSDELVSCSDSNNNIYFVYNKTLYKNSGNTTLSLGSFPVNSYSYKIAYYNDKLYCLYLDSNSKMQLACWNKGSLTSLYQPSALSFNEIDMTAAEDGLYFTGICSSGSKDSLYAYKSNGQAALPISELAITSSNALSNPKIMAANGHLVVIARQWTNSNKLIFRKLSDSGWVDVSSSVTLASAYPVAAINGNTLYTISLQNDSASTNVYSLDLSSDSSVFTKYNKTKLSDASITSASFSFSGSTPYLAIGEYQNSKNQAACLKLESGRVSRLGASITGSHNSDLTLYQGQNLLKVLYSNIESNGTSVYIKQYSVDNSAGAPTASPKPTVSPKPTAVPTTKPTVNPTAEPTAKPTTNPTAAPTAKPTTNPTAAPTAKPTANPTAAPTAKPTANPTAAPTAKPTEKPTDGPTVKPTVSPSVRPTAVPTESTASPSPEPSVTSAVSPSGIPAVSPTKDPAAPTEANSPTVAPVGPTETASPTEAPAGPTEATSPTEAPAVPTETTSPSKAPASPTEATSPTEPPASPTETTRPTEAPSSPTVSPAVSPTSPPLPTRGANMPNNAEKTDSEPSNAFTVLVALLVIFALAGAVIYIFVIKRKKKEH